MQKHRLRRPRLPPQGRTRGFEGWYHRLTVGEDSLAFIYSIFDPADPKSARHGVGAQLCGPADDYLYRSGDATNFWADEKNLRLGHTFQGVPFGRETPSQAFQRFVSDGFQLSATRHQGQIAHPDGGQIRWCCKRRRAPTLDSQFNRDR